MAAGSFHCGFVFGRNDFHSRLCVLRSNMDLWTPYLQAVICAARDRCPLVAKIKNRRPSPAHGPARTACALGGSQEHRGRHGDSCALMRSKTQGQVARKCARHEGGALLLQSGGEGEDGAGGGGAALPTPTAVGRCAVRDVRCAAPTRPPRVHHEAPEDAAHRGALAGSRARPRACRVLIAGSPHHARGPSGVRCGVCGLWNLWPVGVLFWLCWSEITASAWLATSRNPATSHGRTTT